MRTFTALLIFLVGAQTANAQTDPHPHNPGVAAAQPLVRATSRAEATPPPGAPTSACDFSDAPAGTPVKLLAGPGPIPYVFACGHNRPAGVCAVLTHDPGVLVAAGEQKSGWTCISGGDMTSGWVPSTHVVEVPTTPAVPFADWLGYWHKGRDLKGVRNDRMLIQRGTGSGQLTVSGRAYWYGLNHNVHSGGIRPTTSTPTGSWLHLVEGDTLGSCVLDLEFHPPGHSFTAFDNGNCGGMNVRFSGIWTRFEPRTTPLGRTRPVR